MTRTKKRKVRKPRTYQECKMSIRVHSPYTFEMSFPYWRHVRQAKEARRLAAWLIKFVEWSESKGSK